MTARIVGLEEEPALGSHETLMNQVRDNLGRIDRMEAEQPDALNFTAELIAVGARPIHRVKSLLRPAHLPGSNWREAWRGLRDPGFIGLGCLATSIRIEAKQSLGAITEVLARRCGKALVSIDGSTPVALRPTLGRVAQEIADVVNAVMAAGDDIDAAELAAIKREYREAEDAMVRLRVAIHQAEVKVSR